MDQTEKQLIHGLFDRLDQAERTAPPRDGEAESFIRERIGSQPGAPYFMAQTIIVQDQALAAAKARIDELEAGTASGSQQSAASRGGLFGNLTGGSSPASQRPASSAWGQRGSASVPSAGMRRGGGGGGFLAGAAQTALGVAGGVMLGSMLGSLFAGDDTAAADAGGADETAAAEPEADAGYEETGFDDGGDFGGGFDDI
ncbi:MAG: DUF2076 domain-containing protein [Aurantimonas endophytica]|uniref:DUF2076 domain-containing protein n=1 Tax=Aurantimonas endophytica TaxID=1522175 RepID=A0A7W6H9H3_9HYPH|nr:DUF2076 domain-containing protein [Aurantimonas endophytica]MBB4001061.1 hypothetical protein [Aurantimonas endophytica]MCO6403283.1 DUF2076 family protein [Aurantimonas endophytica]